MRTVHYNDLEVEILDIQMSTHVEDCFIVSATYVESGIELTDDELSELTDLHADLIYEEFQEYQIGRAEAWADAREDR